MSLKPSDIEKLALLARINISENESKLVTERVGAVLDLVDQLQAQDTEGVEPMAHPMDAIQILRTDEVTESNDRDNLMSNAPAREDGLFLVPRVIE